MSFAAAGVDPFLAVALAARQALGNVLGGGVMQDVLEARLAFEADQAAGVPVTGVDAPLLADESGRRPSFSL